MRLRRRDTAGSLVPPAGRLTIPVLAPTGGAGRSTLAYLLAAGLAEHARTLLVDTAGFPASPWADWLTRPAGDQDAAETIQALGEGTSEGSSEGSSQGWSQGWSVSARQVYAAAGRVATGTGGEFAVLHATPATARTMVDLFAPRVALVDTELSVLAALSGNGPPAPGGMPGQLVGGLLGGVGEWLTAPACAPLLCAPAGAKGITDLSVAVHRLRECGLPTQRILVAVVGIAAPDMPRRVQAGLTLLAPYVAGTACVPHEPRLHAVGIPSWARSTPRLRTSVGQLLHALTTPSAGDADPPTEPPVDPPVDPGAPASTAATPTTGGTDALAHPR